MRQPSYARRTWWPVAAAALLACGQEAPAPPPRAARSSALTISGPSLLTQRYDNARTGANTAEATLTPANVNASTFGKLFSLAVDGAVYAQPLYVPGVATASGTHDLLVVATEHDTVFAFDAAAQGPPLWTASLTSTAYGAGANATPVPSTDVSCGDLTPEIGITGTPVVDPGSGTLYVVAKTKDATGYVQRLHALDVATGQPKGSAVIRPSVAGNGAGSSGGSLTLDPKMQLQRTGLLLQDGVVAFGFGSHCDNPTYHGWVVAYATSTLALAGAWASTPNGTQGGTWMAGGGIAADSSNHAYVATGNGTFDGATEFGDSIVRLTLTGLPVAGSFTPSEQSFLSQNDLDLGSGGVLVLPDPQPGSHSSLLVEAGKTGTIYLIDRTAMGDAGGGIVQTLTGGLAGGHATDGNYGTPAYWNGTVYFQSTADALKAFTISSSGMLSLAKQSSSTIPFPGASPVVSANGTSNGIVWTIDSSAYKSAGPAVLHAYDPAASATGLPELYNSAQSATRDRAGPAVKFTVPTVVNGRVYVPASGEVDVYGLLTTQAGTTAMPTFSPTPKAYSTPQSVTISDATPSAAIYYTTDGSTPTTSSTPYTTAIAVSTTLTVKAIAVAPGLAQSAVASGKYTIRKR